MTLRKRFAATLAAAALMVGAGAVGAGDLPAAYAASSVTVTNADGVAAADPDYATEVTVSGTGFQSIPKGFGGVYVLFGWVSDGGWKPSAGGLVGTDFRYVPDSEALDNQGFMRFVAFPGSDTESTAHAVMSADGSWSVSMVVPGASFESQDRSGNTSSINCREVTCGIITFGAHGVKNANNETFTPITFSAPAAGATGGGAGGGAAGGEQAGSEETPQAAAGDVRVGLAHSTVQAGASIVFTGQGFAPGEQVVAALDDGVTAIGPLIAGSRGEVAGALPVPRDARGGTHLVSLTGAASGAIAQSEVAIESDAAVTPVSGDSGQAPQWTVLVLLAAIVIALILVVASAISSLRRARARRKAAQAVAATHPAPAVSDVTTARTGDNAKTEVLEFTGAAR